MASPQAEPPRWLYRFDNFDRAFSLLGEAVDLSRQRPLSQLEREGLIQRFEYTWELAWKLLRDFLAAQGVDLPTVTPLAAIRAAVAARLIDRGEIWMRALEARNKMSHIYSAKGFEEVMAAIQTDFISILSDLHRFAGTRAAEMRP